MDGRVGPTPSVTLPEACREALVSGVLSAWRDRRRVVWAVQKQGAILSLTFFYPASLDGNETDR